MEANNSFTPEFIGFFSNIYAPLGACNDPTNLNCNHFKNLLISYGKYKWRPFDNVDTILAQNFDNLKKWETKVSSDIIGSTTPEDFLENAGKHIWKEYVWWGWRKDESVTDCSGLVIMSMQQTWVADHGYNNTAEWLSKITKQKSPAEVQKWDLVFLQNEDGHITHVEIALWNVENWKIPIIDASRKAGWVTTRYQNISSKVLVWTPTFYKA
jgi:hypothetical protein